MPRGKMLRSLVLLWWTFLAAVGVFLVTELSRRNRLERDVSEQILSRYQRDLLADLEFQPEQPDTGKYAVLEQMTVHVGNSTNHHEYGYFINNANLCEGFNNLSKKLLIFVESSVQHSERRMAIRDTWGQLQLQKALNFRLVFMLGRSFEEVQQEDVQKESYRYGDVVQENFTESFEHLTLKSVMGLKWATSFCPCDFVMKTDDDIFINVPNLLMALEKQDPRTLLCHRNRVRAIIRTNMLDDRQIPLSYRKYRVSETVIPGTMYPPYCAGLGYIASASTAKILYLTSLVTPYLFIEDVYITGFCRQKAGVNIEDHPGLTLKPRVDPAQGSCAFRDGRITSQEMGPKEMRDLWKEINTQGFFCPRVVGYIPI